MFTLPDLDQARAVVALLTREKLMISTAESCTGGLVAALITEVPGSSGVFERGFITYSNAAKCDLLGVPATLIGRFGAVSGEVAVAMASGALKASTADIALSVTGVAGPGGGTSAKPVGLVHIAGQRRGAQPIHHALELGDIGRNAIRLATVRRVLALAMALAQRSDSEPSGTP